MLIPLGEMIQAHQMSLHGVFHVGAHEAEEAGAYKAAGVQDVWWVEGDPQVIKRLPRFLRRHGPGHRIIEAVVTDKDYGWATFHRANNFQSSSVLAFGTHRRVSPEVHFVGDEELRTRTVDSLIAEHGIVANFWNFDIQGAELLALKGADKSIKMVDYLYTEINVDELYVGCARLKDLDLWLEDRGFVRCDTRMAGNAGWGDALYVRRGIRP